MKFRIRGSALVVVALSLVSTAPSAVALGLGGKEIVGPRQGRPAVRLFVDPDLKQQHSLKTVPASAGFPLAVLEEAPNGALRVHFKSGAESIDGWAHPLDARTDLKANAECLVAQQSVAPIGATRGANEGCLSLNSLQPTGAGKRK